MKMTEIFFDALCRLAAITNEAPLHDH
ncbi:protein YrbN [Photorhabdus laumondii subsp. laumondii]|uniref:Protein YrbN n=7 Tax=Photorhabdus TaxID=29487 RepID=A0ABX0B3S7_9GAMM|nr:hypothetical protein PluDJC_22385 [Photorhabdus laumondii subsp. laumondii]MBS9422860.1 protein YrbN [Photorhabdus caribbeanensis]MBS9428188.1 protein YrbN [Photorhabdus akhurstii]MBS9431380.1 protein YrbN [Photorhabdus hainanensis]MBS9436192.1 protein YrbN [Photorhabdus noenieputensis]MCC8372812.1 protein YrbN [Photorhabdus bodei]MCC8382870.1 protein YrbN [Photorhabdus laumondii]MCC8456121.1 protein YrbN [Photorhabdus aegyptia]MCT8342474.1 protein YrbN [Photorhabdus kleinii]MCT8351331.